MNGLLGPGVAPARRDAPPPRLLGTAPEVRVGLLGAARAAPAAADTMLDRYGRRIGRALAPIFAPPYGIPAPILATWWRRPRPTMAASTARSRVLTNTCCSTARSSPISGCARPALWAGLTAVGAQALQDSGALDATQSRKLERDLNVLGDAALFPGGAARRLPPTRRAPKTPDPHVFRHPLESARAEPWYRAVSGRNPLRSVVDFYNEVRAEPGAHRILDFGPVSWNTVRASNALKLGDLSGYRRIIDRDFVNKIRKDHMDDPGLLNRVFGPGVVKALVPLL